jgi:hypothetical protein
MLYGRMAWQTEKDQDNSIQMDLANIAPLLMRTGSLAESAVFVAVNPRTSKE